MREVLDQEFRSHNSRPPPGLVETSSILTTTNLLAHSEMIAVIPTEVAGRYEKHGMLVALPYSLRQRLSEYGLITQQGRPLGPAASQLIAFLKARS